MNAFATANCTATVRCTLKISIVRALQTVG